METPKHGDREKTESGEQQVWTAINHAVGEAARRAGPADKRNSCHFLINGLCQRGALLLLMKARVRLQERGVGGSERKREDSSRRRQCCMMP